MSFAAAKEVGDGELFRIGTKCVKRISLADERWRLWCDKELEKKKEYWGALRLHGFLTPEAFRVENFLFLISPWVEGIDLYQWLESAPSKEEKEAVFTKILDEFIRLEKTAFFHGDIHPGNIILGSGDIHFIDWTHAGKEGDRVWRSSPGFLAPERRVHALLSSWSEIFSFGKLCEKIFGEQGNKHMERACRPIPTQRFSSFQEMKGY